MTSSINSFPLRLTRIGDLRIATPYPCLPLDLWLMLQLWPDAHDRQSLISFQRVIRASPPQPEIKKLAPTPPEEISFGAAVFRLSQSWLQSKLFQARHSFAEAAQRQARRYMLRHQVDFYAVHAGLVKRFWDCTEEQVLLYGTAPKPLALTSLVGAAIVDAELMAGADADEIAINVCREFIDMYPRAGQYTAEDLQLIANADPYTTEG